jgi:Cys-rich protein (TIGR01571 family)
MSLFGCCCLIHTVRREQFREKYGLEEGACGDCFITCCCGPCAICQEAREMKVRGRNFPFFTREMICL